MNKRVCPASGRRLGYYNTKRIADEHGRIKCPACQAMTRIYNGLFIRHFKPAKADRWTSRNAYQASPTQ